MHAECGLQQRFLDRLQVIFKNQFHYLEKKCDFYFWNLTIAL